MIIDYYLKYFIILINIINNIFIICKTEWYTSKFAIRAKS